MTFPDVVSQTRDYIVSARYLVPTTGPAHRVALWDTTLAANGAQAFNEGFMTRWSTPTDPTGWAAHSAVKILFEASQAAGTLDGPALVQYLESPRAVFDLNKGTGVSFRPWDHQLRQPLYVVRVDQDVEWRRDDVATWVALASVAAEYPAAGAAGDSTQRLDQFGDGAADLACRF